MGYRGNTRYQQSKLDRAFAKADREAALRKQQGRCAYCLDLLNYRTVTRDHVQPRKHGGLDHRGNIVAACAPCNRLKGHMPYDLFMRMISEPRRGEPMEYRMVWVSRRLNTALIGMERNLDRFFGRVR